MNYLLRPPFPALALASLVASFGCGNPPPPTGQFTGQPPFLTDLHGSVRNIVVTGYPGSAQIGEPAACSLEADLFDTTAPATRTVMGTSGECTLYSATPLPITSQSWICAGAIIADYGGHQEILAMCPSAGSMIRPSAPIPCTGLDPAASVAISSASEPGNDVVTDLAASITLPGAVAFTQPTTLGVLTWPTSGALNVQWTSANATTALVVVEARTNPSQSPSIVCVPSTNPQVSIADSLIAPVNFRTMDAVIRVFSYRDTTTTAEGGKTYHLWGGVEAATLLQAIH